MRNIRIDGKVPSNQRQSLIDKFQARVSNLACTAGGAPYHCARGGMDASFC